MPSRNKELFQAIESNHISHIKRLLKEGFDVNEGYHERTFLMIAVEHANPVITNLLLAHKADPNLTKSDKSPLEIAIFNALLRSFEGIPTPEDLVLKRLLAYQAIDQNNLLPHYYVARGHIHHLQHCVAKGLDINAVTPPFDSLLVNAAKHTSFKIIKYLLDQGADPNLKVNGITPLEALALNPYMRTKKKKKAITLLLARGVASNLILLFNALEHKNYDQMFLHLMNGVSIHSTNALGQTILGAVLAHPFKKDQYKRYVIQRLLLNGASLKAHEVSALYVHDEFMSVTSDDLESDIETYHSNITIEVSDYLTYTQLLKQKVHTTLRQFIQDPTIDETLGEAILFFRIWANRFNTFYRDLIKYCVQSQDLASSPSLGMRVRTTINSFFKHKIPGAINTQSKACKKLLDVKQQKHNLLDRLETHLVQTKKTRTCFFLCLKGYQSREQSHLEQTNIGFNLFEKLPIELKFMVLETLFDLDFKLIISGYNQYNENTAQIVTVFFREKLNIDWSQMYVSSSQRHAYP